tara:strand:- start:79 stop:507 length:429 start_codon:yes stop_codon:yes gene_type:complete
MTLRTKRIKKTAITKLPDSYILKVRLIPWDYDDEGCIWLASMAISKSMRQINDWMEERKNRRSKILGLSLTGLFASKPQILAMKKVREWMKEIPKGDAIILHCESCLSDKQFKVWTKWFKSREDEHWEIYPNNKSFFYSNYD